MNLNPKLGSKHRNTGCPNCGKRSHVNYRSTTKDCRCLDCGCVFPSNRPVPSGVAQKELPVAMRAFHRQL